MCSYVLLLSHGSQYKKENCATKAKTLMIMKIEVEFQEAHHCHDQQHENIQGTLFSCKLLAYNVLWVYKK